MSGSFRDGELDPTPRSPQVPRWLACRCEDVGRGGCRCYEDDGQVTHGGVFREGWEAGVYRSGERVQCVNGGRRGR